MRRTLAIMVAITAALTLNTSPAVAAAGRIVISDGNNEPVSVVNNPSGCYQLPSGHGVWNGTNVVIYLNRESDCSHWVNVPVKPTDDMQNDTEKTIGIKVP